MAKHLLHIVFLLSLGHTAMAQNTYFHKVFRLPNQNNTRPYNVKFLDSNYYITGHVDSPAGAGVLFLKLDKQGNFIDTIYHIDTVNYDLAGYSRTKLDTNTNGNFMLHFRGTETSGNTINKHTRIELDRNGQVLFKDYLDTFLNNDMDCRDFGELVIDNSNDCYYTADHFITDSAGFGIVMVKFSQSSDSLIWMKKILSTAATNGIYLSKSKLLKFDNGNILLTYSALKGTYFDPLGSQFAKTYIQKYNPSGQLIQQKILFNDVYTASGFGAKLVNDEKELVLCLTQSEIKYTSSGFPYLGLTFSIAKLDSNFNVAWQENLGGAVYNTNNVFSGSRTVDNFVVSNDTSIVSGSFYGEVGGGADTTKTTYFRLENRSLSDGHSNWVRKIQYYSALIPLKHPHYDIGDIQNTPDGGFVAVGQVINLDSISQGKPGFLGYIVKTNCLGFLGDPQAGFTAQNSDSLGVYFQNTSLMGGSYLWDFGDSNLVSTGEYSDSIFHQYSDTGTYEVTLIAYGCNGANDTLKTSIHISKNAPEEPVNPNIINYMAIGPNPVQSGESIAVYVGNLPSENCTLSFYDERGKVVLEHCIPLSNSTNIIVLPFSAGVYQAVLRDGEKRLEVEKVLVR